MDGFHEFRLAYFSAIWLIVIVWTGVIVCGMLDRFRGETPFPAPSKAPSEMLDGVFPTPGQPLPKMADAARFCRSNWGFAVTHNRPGHCPIAAGDRQHRDHDF